MINFGSRFELAFRRSLFTLLLLIAYLLLGSFLLSFFAKLEQSKWIAEECNNQREAQKGRRVDFERTELLNILWAESMTAKSESDWSLVANTKLDAYERLLLSLLSSSNSGWNSEKNILTRINHFCATDGPSLLLQKWDFLESFRSALLFLSTTGGGPLTEQPPEQLGPATKLFVIIWSLLGIPLLFIHLEYSGKALAALIEANFDTPKWALLAISSCGILLAALAMDIALVKDDDDEEEHSFLDSIFTVVLAFSTISGSGQLRQLPLPLLLPLLFFLHTLFGCLLSTLTASFHRWLAPHEFAFANGFCGKIEKVVSGARLDQQNDDAEEEEREKSGKEGRSKKIGHWGNGDRMGRGIPLLRFGICGEDMGMGLTEGDKEAAGNGDGEEGTETEEEEPNTTASLLALHRKQSISTIEEEESEQLMMMNNMNSQQQQDEDEEGEEQEEEQLTK